MKHLLFFLLLPCLSFAQSADSLAIEKLKAEIKMLQEKPETPRLGWAYRELADQYEHRFGYNKYSLDAYFESMNVFGRQGDSARYYQMHVLIGDYYGRDAFMQPDIRRYFGRALAYYNRQHDVVGQLTCRLGIAGTQISPKTPPAVLAEFRACNQLSQQHRQPEYQARATNLLANAYLRQQRWDSARYYAQTSLAIATKQRISWLVRVNLFYLGLERQYQFQPKAAIAYFERAMVYGVDQPNIAELRDIGRHLSDTYAAVGNYDQAYRYARRVVDFTNEFYNSEQTRNIRLQELNLRVKNLEVEKQLVEQQEQHQRLVNSMLIAGLILSIVAVVVLIILRRQQGLISHQKDIISRQRIRQLELESLRALIDGQEKERTRIARDLHDGLGAQLSRIKLFAEAHIGQLSPVVHQPLNQFIDDACQEVRLIANNLRPYTLSTFGLLTALEDLTNKLRQVNETCVTFDHYGELSPLDDEQAVMLYRVVQELLSNALKHANATTVDLQLMANGETLLISVEDNGRGFDPHQTSTGDGLPNIRSRVDYLGGQVIWQSEPGRGTSVMISIPMATAPVPANTPTPTAVPVTEPA